MKPSKYGLFLILGLVLLGFSADANAGTWARGRFGNECTMIPPNRQVYPESRDAAGITEGEFNTILDQVDKIYRPIVEAKGGKLVIERNWSDDTVNAYASRIGDSWLISMFGGLARHPEATFEAFAMVACHELGHHIGGIPKKGARWASVEGQSDYYATLKCMRKVFTGTDNWRALRRLTAEGEVDPVVTERCQAGHGTSKQDFAMCVRSTVGGLALARLLADVGGSKMPEFTTPDTTVVTRTNEQHPNAQCRLDTYFAGAVCPVSHDVDVSDTDVKVGTCMPNTAARDRRSFSANTWGSRSACWFKAPAFRGYGPAALQTSL